MPSNPALAADPDRCPLCGQTNQCAKQIETASGVKQPECWCTQLQFSAELLEQVPAQARNCACICRRCANTVAAT